MKHSLYPFDNTIEQFTKEAYTLQENRTGPLDIQDIYSQFYNDVYQYCLYFTNNNTEAEDLTQETFIKILRSIDSFHGLSSVRTWVLSIARYTAIDYYRRKKLLQFIPFVSTEKEQISPLGNPEDLYELKEDWEQLQDALLKLKPDYRSVIILRGLKQLTIKETAEILKWKESKVRVQYHRALKMLQEQMKDLSEGGLYLNEQTREV